MLARWSDPCPERPAHHGVALIVSPEIRALLEKRRLLDEDLRLAIHHAETGGRFLVHPVTGRRKACVRPYKTTIWVEYTADVDGFVIHDAYSHRMTVAGGKP